jgi:hypothetical protein
VPQSERSRLARDGAAAVGQIREFGAPYNQVPDGFQSRDTYLTTIRDQG